MSNPLDQAYPIYHWKILATYDADDSDTIDKKKQVDLLRTLSEFF